MRLPNSLTDDELKAYAEEHLQYEVDMLAWSAGILTSLATYKDKGPLPLVITNRLLNTFAVHARNLIDFLYSGSRNKDFPTDIIIEDYVDRNTLAKALPKISPLLKEAQKKAHKQVAHLTRERIDYEKAGKEWRFIEVAQSARHALASVAPSIPTSRISDNFRQKISSNRLEIPKINIALKNAPNGNPIGVCLSVELREAGVRSE